MSLGSPETGLEKVNPVATKLLLDWLSFPIIVTLPTSQKSVEFPSPPCTPNEFSPLHSSHSGYAIKYNSLCEPSCNLYANLLIGL